MLSILAADENTARRLSRKKGLPDTAACMVALERDRTAGYVLYTAEEGRVCLLHAQADTAPVLDGLLRGAMNAGYLAGCLEAVCTNPELFPVLEGLRFTSTPGLCRCSLSEFFHRPCNGR